MPTKSSQPRPRKHIPQRTCIACGTTKPKRELLRVVRTPQGAVELDAGGKKSGRGAYVCARRSCWELALKKHRLEHEFELESLPPPAAPRWKRSWRRCRKGHEGK